MNRIQEFTSKLSPTKSLAGRFKEKDETEEKKEKKEKEEKEEKKKKEEKEETEEKEKKEKKENNERDGFEFMIPSTPGKTIKLAC